MGSADDRLSIGSSQIKILSAFQMIPEHGLIDGGFSLIGLAVVKKGLNHEHTCGEERVNHPILLEKKVPFQVVLVRFAQSGVGDAKSP